MEDNLEIQEEQKLYTEEDVVSLIETFQSPIEFKLDNVQGVEIDQELFKSGVESISFLCGKLSALKSIGFSTQQVFEYMMMVESENVSDIVD